MPDDVYVDVEKFSSRANARVDDSAAAPFMPSILLQLGTPALVSLASNVFAAKFDLMKFTPAKAILDDALSKRLLFPGGRVIESSSGTFALALAILCSLYNLRLTLVTGPLSAVVRWRLENLGAEIVIVQTANNCEGGIQQARLNVLASLLKKHPDAFWPQQYTNPLNAGSYEPIALQLVKALPGIDTLVGTVGSGGSLFGMARVLRRVNPHLKVVAIDHNRSVIFGAQPSRITRMCRETYEQLLAMGAGIPMGNVDYPACDVVHWVPVPQMVRAVHRFHRATGYLVGPSSGAALDVAYWEGQSWKRSNVLTLLPDHGVRYADTMFNPDWLSRWTDDLETSEVKPRFVGSPADIHEHWSAFLWKRASFENVHGHSPRPREQGFNP